MNLKEAITVSKGFHQHESAENLSLYKSASVAAAIPGSKYTVHNEVAVGLFFKSATASYVGDAHALCKEAAFHVGNLMKLAEVSHIGKTELIEKLASTVVVEISCQRSLDRSAGAEQHAMIEKVAQENREHCAQLISELILSTKVSDPQIEKNASNRLTREIAEQLFKSTPKALTNKTAKLPKRNAVQKLMFPDEKVRNVQSTVYTDLAKRSRKYTPAGTIPKMFRGIGSKSKYTQSESIAKSEKLRKKLGEPSRKETLKDSLVKSFSQTNAKRAKNPAYWKINPNG